MHRSVSFADYLDEIQDVGIATVQKFIPPEIRVMLLEELACYHMQEQPAVYGGHGVRQSFSSVEVFPELSLFRILRDVLQKDLHEQIKRADECALVEPLQLTDLVVQRYQSGPLGISPHRDGKSFVNLILVIVLEGSARFYLCDDREGSNAKSVRNRPGDLLLMRGYGFQGSIEQPFHGVDNITAQRTTFALRQKTTAKVT